MALGIYFKTQRLIGRAKKLRKTCEAQNELTQVLETARLERKFSFVQDLEQDGLGIGVIRWKKN